MPYMIGDMPGGNVGAFMLNGPINATLSHPTLGGDRLNIAELNNPVPADRLYFNYRHFQATTDIAASAPGAPPIANSLGIDRYIFGGEWAFGQRTSIELRLPVDTEFTSNILLNSNFPPNQAPGVPLSVSDGRRTELGNLGIILKQGLFVSDSFYLSGGLGLNVPTAPGVHLTATSNNQVNVFIPTVGFATSQQTVLNASQTNETVNLQPYLGGYWTPGGRWFGLGFAQFDVPLNESTVRLNAQSVTNGQFITGNNTTATTIASASDTSGRIAEQDLFRLNLGGGAWLWDNAGNGGTSLGLMVEFHYTTTLSNAGAFGPVPVTQGITGQNRGLPPIQVVPPETFAVGNVANRVDVANMAIGIPFLFRGTNITNGFIFPLRTGDNRNFSFEYNVFVQRSF